MTASLKILLPYYTASCLLLVAFGLFKLLYFLPFAHNLIEAMIRKLSTIEMQKEDYWNGLFGWKMFNTYQKLILRELQREAYLNRQTPNPLLASVDGNTTHRLLDWARGSRPLVVNFGSCTCPVFMARLQQFGEMVEEFSNIADFLTIYIEEAHPIDEWRFKVNNYCGQHAKFTPHVIYRTNLSFVGHFGTILKTKRRCSVRLTLGCYCEQVFVQSGNLRAKVRS